MFSVWESFAFIVLLSYLAITISKDNNSPVSCGSAIKLVHKETGYNLHSHAIAWGSGSGQQSVTANGNKNDKGSLWLVKEGHHVDLCEPGTPVKCGDVIRLEHVDTAKNLHSHLFRSPVSGGQEVSGFGERGEGDTGDSWKVICESNNDDYWRRYKPVALQHLDTGKFLSTADVYKFTQSNCGMQCPIMGQTEVAAASRKDSKAKWQTDQGVYFPVNIAGENDSDEL